MKMPRKNYIVIEEDRLTIPLRELNDVTSPIPSPAVVLGAMNACIKPEEGMLKACTFMSRGQDSGGKYLRYVLEIEGFDILGKVVIERFIRLYENLTFEQTVEEVTFNG